MPLPFIIGGIALAAGAAGVKSGISGGVKIKDAKETMDVAKNIQAKAEEKFEEKNKSTLRLMDSIGKEELDVLSSFEKFSDIIEKIQNRPEFKSYSQNGVTLPKYEAEQIRNVSVGASVLLGSIGGAALGSVGGVAAAGATTTAVMTFGAASTGTAISSLSGAAATNATLAALGGGALDSSIFAGGMALGSTVLTGATLGVGLMVGGFVINSTGNKLSNQADEAYHQAKKTEEEVEEVCQYLNSLIYYGAKFKKSLLVVSEAYKKRLWKLDFTVNHEKKTNWNDFTEQEKLLTQNTILLVGILYKMCQVKLVKKTEKEDSRDEVNTEEINKAIKQADEVMTNGLSQEAA